MGILKRELKIGEELYVNIYQFFFTFHGCLQRERTCLAENVCAFCPYLVKFIISKFVINGEHCTVDAMNL